MVSIVKEGTELDFYISIASDQNSASDYWRGYQEALTLCRDVALPKMLNREDALERGAVAAVDCLVGWLGPYGDLEEDEKIALKTLIAPIVDAILRLPRT